MGVFEHPFFCKIEKIEGGPFGDIKKIAKKVPQSRNNLHKKFCLRLGLEPKLGRPQKSLINL